MPPFQDKRLSQVFLRDLSYAQDALDLADFSGKNVLEIGAGNGVVTAYLAERAKHVTALELDERYVSELKRRFAKNKNVKIVHGDAMEYPLDCEVVVGFLPYHLSSPLLFRILHSDFGDAILCLQKEFAVRMAAEPDSNDYSKLSVMCQNLCDVQLLAYVPNHAFEPVPKVDSAIVHLFKNPKEPLNEPLVSLLFQHKNQTVRNALWHSRAKLLDSLPALGEASLKKKLASLPLVSRKVRSLSLAELAVLSKAFPVAAD